MRVDHQIQRWKNQSLMFATSLKPFKDQVCRLTIRKTEVLLDPPDKLLDRWRFLEGEQPAKSTFVALGFSKKRDIHGIQGANMLWISSTAREPVVDSAMHTIEGGMW